MAIGILNLGASQQHAILSSGGTLPGDFGSGCYVAYSLRKVVAAYSGAVVRVRRSSDNTAQDFTATQVTDGTLLSFVGAGDGFVDTLFDQKARSGFNLTQSVQANQPIIVQSGVLYTENGKPAMKFDGSRFLRNDTASNWSFLHFDPSSVFSVQKIELANPNTLYAIWATGNSVSGTRVAYFRYDDRAASGFNNDWFHVIGANGAVVINQMPNATGQFVTQKLLTARVHGNPGATSSLRSYVGVNSNALANNNTGTVTRNSSTPTHGLRLGETNGTWRLVGAISEVIIYFGGGINAQSFDSQIDTEMKTYYGIT
jgi:hypothetical protein